MSEEMQELIDMLHKTCQTQAGADEGNIKFSFAFKCFIHKSFTLGLISKAQKGDFTDDGNLKCYMKCLMSEMSTVS